MTRSAFALAVASALAFVSGAASADALPGPVAQALARAGVPQSAIGLYVQQVDAPRPSAIFNASKAMNPASAIKLVTTFAALDLLGPAYTWKTEAYLLGRLQGDVLDGDLLLKGYGDPKLTVENFWLFLRSLRARGLRDIRGDLVLDRSFFDVGEHDPAKFDGEGLRPYNVGADALLVNYKAVRFFFLPSETAQGVSVVPEPKLAQLEVASTVALRDGPCGDWRAGLKYELQQNAAGARASFSGSMPSSCGERVWNLAPLPHNQYVLGV
jgi:D-alanyl-D-alanine carboxypeptidase/D-alanyl-D-alanine-endopeptidase (penicillin-binding protein 4)